MEHFMAHFIVHFCSPAHVLQRLQRQCRRERHMLPANKAYVLNICLTSRRKPAKPRCSLTLVRVENKKKCTINCTIKCTIKCTMRKMYYKIIVHFSFRIVHFIVHFIVQFIVHFLQSTAVLNSNPIFCYSTGAYTVFLKISQSCIFLPGWHVFLHQACALLIAKRTNFLNNKTKIA
jgi:hypothetical protein